jgi:glucitol operon activator protein
MMEKVVIFAFVLLVVQGIFTFFQAKSYRVKLASLRNKGIMGIGSKKGWLRSGNITILICDGRGVIVHGEKMEGMTVFTRFKEIAEVKGIKVADLKKKIEDKLQGRKYQKPSDVAMKQAYKI